MNLVDFQDRCVSESLLLPGRRAIRAPNLRTRDELLKFIDSPACDLNTPTDRACFYAGSELFDQGINCSVIARVSLGMRLDRLEYWEGLTTIGNTPGGLAINAAIGGIELSREDYLEIWGNASHKFASLASGDVTCLLSLFQTHSLFVTRELPELLSNPRVTTINSLDREIVKDICEKKGLLHAAGLVCRAMDTHKNRLATDFDASMMLPLLENVALMRDTGNIHWPDPESIVQSPPIFPSEWEHRDGRTGDREPSEAGLVLNGKTALRR